MHNTQKPENTDVELALGALEPSINPLDMNMEGFDPSPTSLGLHGCQEAEMS